MTVFERINASVSEIRARGQRLVQLNVELLSAELKKKGQEFGAVAAMFAGAALLALYGLGFLLAAIAAIIAIVLPWWAALLIVTAALFLIVAILILVARSRLRRAKSGRPEQTIAEAQASVTAFKEGAAKAKGAVAWRRPAGAADAAPGEEAAPFGPAAAAAKAPGWEAATSSTSAPSPETTPPPPDATVPSPRPADAGPTTPEDTRP